MNEGGETNRWLVGIIGGVGAIAIVIIVGFQAQVDQRQDHAMRQVAEMNAEIHKRQDQQIERMQVRDEAIAETLRDIAERMAVLNAERGRENRR